MKQPIPFCILILFVFFSHINYSQIQSRISGSNATFKILKIVDNYYPDNQFMKPDAGKRFVAFEIMVDNSKSSEEITVASMMIKLKDNNGYEYSIGVISAMIKPTFEGTTDAGDVTRGWIGYELPSNIDIQNLKMAYRGFMDKTDWMPLKKFYENNSSSNATKGVAYKLGKTSLFFDFNLGRVYYAKGTGFTTLKKDDSSNDGRIAFNEYDEKGNFSGTYYFDNDKLEGGKFIRAKDNKEFRFTKSN